jgi:hypothetical protein
MISSGLRDVLGRRHFDSFKSDELDLEREGRSHDKGGAERLRPRSLPFDLRR